MEAIKQRSWYQLGKTYSKSKADKIEQKLRICSEFTIETSEYHPEYHYSDTILVANYEKAFHISDALNTAQNVKFSIKDFFGKCDQIPTHLLKKSLMENSIFVQSKPL